MVTEDDRQLTIADVEGVMPAEEQEPAAEVEIDIPVHPVAAMFPMLSERELDDLAEDIRENGLRNALVKDAAGQLIDGRNRYAACRRAGVEPRFDTLNGQEPVAFILSQNLARRHMTQGQRAVTIALARKTLSLKFSLRQTASLLGVPESALNRANVVVEYAGDLAEQVVFGTKELEPAYTEAKLRKEAAMSEEAKVRRLGRYAPDLVAMVAEGKLTPAAAEMELSQRRAAEEQRKIEAHRYRVGLTQDWLDILSRLDPKAMAPDENARQWLGCDPALLGRTDDVSAERARLCADTLLRYAQMKEEQGDE